MVVLDRVICMSTVIALCSTNYCLLASDSRRVVWDSNENKWTVESDQFRKTDKLNNNILFGATGIFAGNESVFSPFEHVDDIRSLLLPDAVDLIRIYLESSNTWPRYIPRNYIIGGREGSSFAIYAVKYNPSSDTVTVDKRLSYLPSQHACLMALPQSLDRPEMEEKYLGMVSKIFAAPFTLNALKDGLSGVINCIAGDDKGGTVGGRPRFLTIT